MSFLTVPFEYKSHAVWLKNKVGTGYWFRNQHELLLVGTRGNIPAPAFSRIEPERPALRLCLVIRLIIPAVPSGE